MKKIVFYLVLVLFLACAFRAKAQQKSAENISSVKAAVRDTLHKLLLKSATASVYSGTGDRKLISYQITNSYGALSFKNLPLDKPLILEISHVGYRTVTKAFTLKAAIAAIDFGTLIISPSELFLDEVVVTVPPITVNGDTLEFNAPAFKLDSNAVVEDMLRKVPNIVHSYSK